MYQGKTGFERACKFLSNPIDDDDERSQVAEFVLANKRFDPRKTASTVCRVAVLTHDVDLWNRTVTVCCPGLGLDVMSSEYILEALETFEFDDILPR